MDKKLQTPGDGVFGHGEWGRVTNAQYAPSRWAAIPLQTPGDGVSR
jgi:hypothetical protein